MGAAPSKYIGASPSVIVAPASGDSGPVRRNPKHAAALRATAYPEADTLYACFQRGLRTNPKGDCMGQRTVVRETKGEDGKMVRARPALRPPPPPPRPPFSTRSCSSQKPCRACCLNAPPPPSPTARRCLPGSILPRCLPPQRP